MLQVCSSSSSTVKYLPQREYCRTVCRCRGGEREHGFEMLDEKYIQVQGASKKNPWMN